MSDKKTYQKNIKTNTLGYILLSFDLEEFDIPLEYNEQISEEEQYDVTLDGLKSLINLLDKYDIRATFFATATFALRHQDIIKSLSQKHEIASHGYDHKSISTEGIIKSKQILEEIIGQPVIGLRSPRLQEVNNEILKQYNYQYNSSENPIYLPGRYNNFFKTRTAYLDKNNILNIPASASPIIRFPLFWLSFKNFHLTLIKLFSFWTLSYDNYLNIYFHPWEFANLKKYRLPLIIKRHYGTDMLHRFEKYIKFLSRKAKFITLTQFNTFFREK